MPPTPHPPTHHHGVLLPSPQGARTPPTTPLSPALQVCGGPALSLFRGEELELLVCGLPHLDFEQLERGAVYEGGYSR